MKPNFHLKRILKMNLPSKSIADTETSLYKLKNIIKNTKNHEIINAAAQKMLSVFFSKNKMAMQLSITYMKKIRNSLASINTDVLHLLCSNDNEVNDLALKYIAIFPRFFATNNIVFFYAKQLKSKYRNRALRALGSVSTKFWSQCDDKTRQENLLESLRIVDYEVFFTKIDERTKERHYRLYPCLINFIQDNTKPCNLYTMEDDARRAVSSFDKQTKGTNILDTALGYTALNDASLANPMFDKLPANDVALNSKCSKKPLTNIQKLIMLIKTLKEGKYELSRCLLEELCNVKQVSEKFKTIFAYLSEELSTTEKVMCGASNDKKSNTNIGFIFKLHGLYSNGVYKRLNKAHKKGLKLIRTR